MLTDPENDKEQDEKQIKSNVVSDRLNVIPSISLTVRFKHELVAGRLQLSHEKGQRYAY